MHRKQALVNRYICLHSTARWHHVPTAESDRYVFLCWQHMLTDTCIYADIMPTLTAHATNRYMYLCQHIDITCRHHSCRQPLTDDSRARKDAPSSASLAWCWTVSMSRQVRTDCRRSTTRLRYETVATVYALLSPTHKPQCSLKVFWTKRFYLTYN